MRITCFGGVREIGGNKILLEDGDAALFLDFGLPMGRAGQYFDEFVQPRTGAHLIDCLALDLAPRVDGIYRRDLVGNADVVTELGLPPEAKPLFEAGVQDYDQFLKRHGRARARAVLLSHAHLDHVGQVGYLDQRIALGCTPVSRTILSVMEELLPQRIDSEALTVRRRVLDAGGEGSRFPGAPTTKSERVHRRVVVFEEYGEVVVEGFRVEALPVDHSLPGCCALLITAPSGKRVLYTGDLRFNGRWSRGEDSLTERFRARTRDLKPDLLITEGTRIRSNRADDEEAVKRELAEVVTGSPGLVIFDWAWKDIARFQTVAEVARDTGRTLAASPKTLALYHRLSEEHPGLFPSLSSLGDIRAYLERSGSMLFSPSDYKQQLYKLGRRGKWTKDEEEAVRRQWSAEERDSVVSTLLEHWIGGVRAYDVRRAPGKYILQAGFFDIQELIDLDPPSGSVYVRAATEPFSEEMAIDERKLRNWLARFGLLRHEEELRRAHISGHASGPDLLDWIESVKPIRVLPIHTEYPEEFIGKVPGEVVLVEVGETVEA
jgi:ribonuclease J